MNQIQAVKIPFFQRFIQIITGSMILGMLIAIFVVVYSHPIFFSSRWDPYAHRYLEYWYFIIAISVLIPYLLFRIRQEILNYYLIFLGIFLTILITVWIGKLWPLSATDTAYTITGYAFVDNLNIFEPTLYGLCSFFAGICIKTIFTTLSTDSESKLDLIYVIIGGFLFGFVNCLNLYYFPIIGLYILLLGSIIGIIFYIFTKNPNITINFNEISSVVKSDATKADRGNYFRFIFNYMVLFGLIAYSFIELLPKEWATVTSLMGLLFPFFEITGFICIIIFNRIRKSPLHYGNYGIMIRSVILLLTAAFTLFITMLITDYYRYIEQYFIPFLGAIIIGALGAMGIFNRFKQDNHISHFSIIAIIASILPNLLGILAWNEFLARIKGERDGPIPTVQELPLFGDPLAIYNGLILGGLVVGGIYSLIQYLSNTEKTKMGYPRWEGNAIIWFLLLIPTIFYIGAIFYSTRIFEWNSTYLIKNLNNAIVTMSGLTLIIGIFILFGLINMITQMIRTYINKNGNQKKESDNKSLFRIITRLEMKRLSILALISCSFVISALIIHAIPNNEPPYRILYYNSTQMKIWSTNAAEKVSPDYLPGNFISKTDTMELSLVRGETARFHLILSPNTKLTNAHINISTLILENSSLSFPQTGINWFYATYNFEGQEEHLIPGNPTQYRGRENISAEYLQEINEWTIEKNTNQPLWLTFTSDYNTTAGDYIGIIKISASEYGIPLEFPLKIHVLDYQKPLKYRLGTFFGSHDELGRALWRHQRMGYHPAYDYMIPTTFIKSINWSNGIYELNWTGFDNALENCAKEGYTHIIYTWYPEDQTMNNSGEIEFIPRFSTKWNQTVIAILQDAQAHLSTLYYPLPYGQGTIRAIDMVYMELYDEPGKDDAWRLTNYGQILDQAVPDWKLICTTGISAETITWPNYTGPGGVFDVVDVRVQGSMGFRDYLENETIREYYRQYPAEVWFYDINAPWPPYPNSAQAYNPGIQIYQHVLRMYVLVNVTGYLFWTAGDTEWADGGDGYAGWGSGRYFYKVTDGTENWDPGYRFEVLEDGIEVAEMIRHVDAIIAGQTNITSSEIISKALSIRNSFNNLYPSFMEWPKTSELEKLIDAQNQLIEFLVAYA